MRHFTMATIFMLASLVSFSQLEGDAIFAEDQIVTIELDFPETDFWNTLTTNYEDAVYTWAHLTLTDLDGVQQFDSVGVRLKGNSSYNHPGNKKAFKIDFNKYISGQNYDGLKKLNFSNGFKDPSVIREKIFFDVSHAVGVPAPRTSFANVYMNGTFWGFYTVVEQIDDQFLDWAILDDDGNLFKAGDNFGPGEGAADLAYYGTDQASYETRYELKTNEEENDWTDLIQFIDFINNSSDVDFEAQLGDWIELDEYLKSLALDNLFSNLDSYEGSARNYYIYHNLTSGKWEWIKWDGNEAFGSYTNGQQNVESLAVNYVDNDRPLIERIFDNPNLYEQYLIAMCQIREAYFNSSYIDNRIDEVVVLVQASVYADTEKMYSNADFDTNIESNLSSGGPGGGPGGGGPGGGTTFGLKSFVENRGNYIDANVDCSVSIAEVEDVPFAVYPNPSFATSTVVLPNHVIENLTLINSSGSTVKQVFNVESHAYTFKVDVLSAGIYFLQVQTENGQVIQTKLLVE